MLTDELLHELLGRVDLAYLLDQASDQDTNWEEKLSLGETQRLAMARLFYHKPTFAILDECTSGVSTAMEERLYSMCAELGITCITISHRPALQQFHDLKLELDGRGSYTLTPISHTRSYAETAAADGAGHGLGKLVHRESMTQQITEAPLLPPAQDDVSFATQLWHLLKVLQPSWLDATSGKLAALAGVVVLRVALSDRIAHLNGDTVSYLLRQDLNGFKRLVGISLVQCVASAVLAPGLIYLTRSLVRKEEQEEKEKKKEKMDSGDDDAMNHLRYKAKQSKAKKKKKKKKKKPQTRVVNMQSCSQWSAMLLFPHVSFLLPCFLSFFLPIIQNRWPGYRLA